MHSEAKKFLIVAGTLGQGGAERQLLYITQSLIDLGFQVHVATLTKGEFYEKPLEDAGATIHYCGRRSSRLSRMWKIARLARQLKPLRIYSMHFYTNLYAWAAASGVGKKSYGSIRNNVESELGANGALGKLLLGLPNYIVANSLPAVEKLANYRKEGIRYLSNAIDTAAFPYREPSRRQGSPLRIVSIGRLHKQKNYQLALDIVGGLEAEYEYAIYGSGGDEEELLAEIGQRDLGQQVKLMGKTADVHGVLASADVFLLTSDHEGNPNVVLEAMSTGIPVLSTTVGQVSSPD